MYYCIIIGRSLEREKGFTYYITFAKKKFWDRNSWKKLVKEVYIDVLLRRLRTMR